MLIQCLHQLSTCLELHHLLSGNGNLLLVGGVDALTSGTLVDAKCTEANKRNLITGDECILHSGHSSLKSLLCVNLGNACASGNLLN